MLEQLTRSTYFTYDFFGTVLCRFAFMTANVRDCQAFESTIAELSNASIGQSNPELSARLLSCPSQSHISDHATTTFT